MPRPTRHPSDALLALAADGELSPRRQEIVARHLAACVACRDRVTAMRAAVEDLRSAWPPEPFGDRHQRARRQQLRAELAVHADVHRGARHAMPVSVFAAIPRPVWAATVGVAIAVLAGALQMRQAPGDAAARAASPERGALPIALLTPGAVTRVTARDLCPARAIPPRPIPADLRAAVLRDYGMDDVSPDEYELDYLITPELGGATDRRNVWPERYHEGSWNALVKDDLERFLATRVCSGALDLAIAQHDIAADWIRAYKKYFDTDRPMPTRAVRNRPGDGDAPRMVLTAFRRP
jgi:anti-sigma factor RsiW